MKNYITSTYGVKIEPLPAALPKWELKNGHLIDKMGLLHLFINL